MKLDDELRVTEEYIPDAFDKRIRDGLEAAFDSENVSVSEDLIQRTLKAIDKAAAAEDDGSVLDASEGSKKRSKPGRYKVIRIVTTIAAGFVLVFVGLRLVKMGVMTKDSGNSEMMESASSTEASGSSEKFSQNTMDTAAPNFAQEFTKDESMSDSVENADDEFIVAEADAGDKNEAGAESFDGTDNSHNIAAPTDADIEDANGMNSAAISDMNDALNGGTAVELNGEQYRLIDSYLEKKQLAGTEYEEVEAQPSFAAVYNDGGNSSYIIVIDPYVLRVEYNSAAKSGVLNAYLADDPLSLTEELKSEMNGE